MARRRIDAIEGYAIVRVESHLTRSDTPRDQKSPGPSDVTVKEVVLSSDEAEREVERLNRLDASKGCRYYWQLTRIFLDGGSFGSGDKGGGKLA